GHLRGGTEARGDARCLIVGGCVDVLASVDRGLKRQQQLAKAREVRRALKYLSNRQRASLPRSLAGQRRRDAGTERADRPDPVALRREAVGFGEEVGRRAGTTRRQRDRPAEAATRRAPENEHDRAD